jgi:hypothetical protein
MMKRTTGQEMAEKFSAFVNITTHDKEGFAAAVATEHRFLQEEMFECMLACMENWAKAEETGVYDARNQYAVKASKIMIKALKEQHYI